MNNVFQLDCLFSELRLVKLGHILENLKSYFLHYYVIKKIALVISNRNKL